MPVVILVLGIRLGLLLPKRPRPDDHPPTDPFYCPLTPLQINVEPQKGVALKELLYRRQFLMVGVPCQFAEE